MQTYLEIFLIGLLGSMHCIGMCGGFVAMYSLRKPGASPLYLYHLLYNLGRTTTYTFLGGVMGFIGSFAGYLGSMRGIPGAALLIAGLIMVVMGLNIAGLFGKRGMFEEAGITDRPRFRNALHRSLSMESAWGVFIFGLVLGFIPCGLLYPVFINAAASGGVVSGMTTMLLFGLGTVPAMMSFGFLMTKLAPRLRLALYRVAAVLIILIGARTLLRGMAFNGWIPPGRFW